MSSSTAARHPFLARLGDLETRLFGSGPDWLRRLRRQALARFEELDFPTTRLEEWKNTNIGAIAHTVFQPAAEAAPPALEAWPGPAAQALGGPRLVFVNGRLLAGASTIGADLPEGVWLGSLARAWQTIPERIEAHFLARDPETCSAFCALNTALFEDGALVLIPDGVEFDRPIELVWLSVPSAEPGLIQPRTLIVCGAGARATVVETYAATAAETYFTNAVTDVAVGADASLDHHRLQLEGPAGLHVSTWASRQARDSRYVSHNFDLGGRLVRHDVLSVLDGEGADLRMEGLYLTRDEQHVDNHTVIDHARPHGSSREVYKGILADASRTVFNGRIVVRPGAQKTDSKQSNPNLLLSERALAHTRPQLEIYADDVRCTHGATIGRLDEDAIFYLRARGIDRGAAERLLVEAFAGEILDHVAIAPLREALREAFRRRLFRGEAPR